MKIKIIDDDQSFIQDFYSRLSIDFKDAIIDYSRDIIYDADIYFLDIDMPSKNGIDFANDIKLHNEDAIIIYVTYRDDLVFDALQTFPYYFLRKRNIDKELPIVIEKLKNRFNVGEIELMYKNKTQTLNLNSIYYIEKDGQYCQIVMKDKKLKVRYTMKWFVSHLPATLFGKVSQSELVNYKYVLSENKTYITTKDNHIFYYSRGKRKEFVKGYLNYRT